MNKHITREHKMILQARLARGLSQQQVATLIRIQIRQYQRLEYGESDVQKLGVRAGLSLCIVLELDPYDLIFDANSMATETLRHNAEHLLSGKKASHREAPAVTEKNPAQDPST